MFKDYLVGFKKLGEVYLFEYGETIERDEKNDNALAI
jgi:hypothetical protein